MAHQLVVVTMTRTRSMVITYTAFLYVKPGMKIPGRIHCKQCKDIQVSCKVVGTGAYGDVLYLGGQWC
jgi:hypothetical protein